MIPEPFYTAIKWVLGFFGLVVIVFLGVKILGMFGITVPSDWLWLVVAVGLLLGVFYWGKSPRV